MKASKLCKSFVVQTLFWYIYIYKIIWNQHITKSCLSDCRFSQFDFTFAYSTYLQRLQDVPFVFDMQALDLPVCWLLEKHSLNGGLSFFDVTGLESYESVCWSDIFWKYDDKLLPRLCALTIHDWVSPSRIKAVEDVRAATYGSHLFDQYCLRNNIVGNKETWVTKRSRLEESRCARLLFDTQGNVFALLLTVVNKILRKERK